MLAAAAREQLEETGDRRHRKQNLICISRGKSLRSAQSRVVRPVPSTEGIAASA